MNPRWPWLCYALWFAVLLLEVLFPELRNYKVFWFFFGVFTGMGPLTVVYNGVVRRH